MARGSTIHASAVLLGTHALLIRGPAGSGKSRLAFTLIAQSPSARLPLVRLVGDDRVHLHRENDRLVVSAAEPLAGLIEVRGLGIRRLPYEPEAVVGCVIDLAAADAERLPEGTETEVLGVRVPRIGVPPGFDPVPLVLAHVISEPAAV
jgi:serine kinase of HPr protein (carbohydrate metabolism regulator)